MDKTKEVQHKCYTSKIRLLCKPNYDAVNHLLYKRHRNLEKVASQKIFLISQIEIFYKI